MPGVLATPIAPRGGKKTTRAQSLQVSQNIGIPCAMVLASYLVLTPERPGFVVSVAARVVRRVGPVRADIAIPRDLAPATGAPDPHDLAVRKPRASSNA